MLGGMLGIDGVLRGIHDELKRIRARGEEAPTPAPMQTRIDPTSQRLLLEIREELITIRVIEEERAKRDGLVLPARWE
jgi:hypothetical protein